MYLVQQSINVLYGTIHALLLSLYW